MQVCGGFSSLFSQLFQLVQTLSPAVFFLNDSFDDHHEVPPLDGAGQFVFA